MITFAQLTQNGMTRLFYLTEEDTELAFKQAFELAEECMDEWEFNWDAESASNLQGDTLELITLESNRPAELYL